jgi:protein disulfide-isomerase A6
MKPAWDQLGDEYQGSSSVLIGDADCTVESELCGKHGVRGYPTIKYYTSETGKDGASYSGGRSYDDLKKFAEDELSVGCTVDDQSTCSEREVKFITKMQGKSADDVAAQITRLEGMANKPMKAELKAWVGQRLAILKQM